MNKQDIKKKYKKEKKLLQKYNHHYFNLDSPLVSDAKYDQIKSHVIKLEKEFPKYKDKRLHEYKNYCEVKKTSNNWNFFPPLTYKVFSLLNSSQTTKFLSKKLKIPKVIPDYGLHGGGWHLMHHKGKLNPHLDYFIHPKANLQRKYNF